MKLASLVPQVTPVLQYHWEWPIPLGGKIIQKQTEDTNPYSCYNFRYLHVVELFSALTSPVSIKKMANS